MSIFQKLGQFLCALGIHAQGHIQHLGGELRSICARCGRL